MSSQPIKAVLFDLGNVVVSISFVNMLAALGIATESEKAAFKILQDWTFHDPFERGALSWSRVQTEIARRLPKPLEERTIIAALNQVFVDVVPDLIPMLHELRQRGITLAVLSNTNQVHWDFACEKFQLKKHFDHLLASHVLGARKPEAAIYQKAVETLGVPAEQCLFFDDLLANIQGARDCGLQAEQVVCSAPTVRQILKQYGALA